MGWLRSNWLDAIIFLLVAVIMAGVVFFLTGVNPLTALQGGGQPQASPSAQSSTPSTVPTKPPQNNPQTPSKPAISPKPVAPAEAKPGETVVTVIPTSPNDSQSAKPVPAPPKVVDQTSTQPPAPATPKPQPPAPTADTGGSWRVTVGSFADVSNANRLADTLRKQGYPVSLETSGNLTRVWVGPYADQPKAQSIANDLGQYSPRVSRAPAAPSSAVTPATPSASTGRFLQVGAYRNRETAQATVNKVKEAGYNAVLVEENGLVKVRVGPLDNTGAAATALRAKGLEVLEVR